MTTRFHGGHAQLCQLLDAEFTREQLRDHARCMGIPRGQNKRETIINLLAWRSRTQLQLGLYVTVSI